VITRLGLAVVVVIMAASSCGGSSPDHEVNVEPRPTTSAKPEFADADMWLSFDEEALGYDGSTAYPDAAVGSRAGVVVTANDGTIERVPGADGSGSAVSFPAKCTDPTGCPRAMVEVLHDPRLNPGLDDFEYGASVWLAPDQTTAGSNVMQKGRFGTEGGLWKLQVDDEDGKPSCVVGSGDQLLTVRSPVSIADSSWHHVVCRRDRAGLTIEVDGDANQKPGPAVQVSNEFPIRIGSPGVNDQDDQFHGRIDNAFLRIGPRT
jgi:hypothetical protein